jgi:hypothetical protein
MMHRLPAQQQNPPAMGPAATVLPTDFLAEQTLGLMAPYHRVISAGGGYSVLSNSPAMLQYQPNIVHAMGGAAAQQRLLAGQQQQRAMLERNSPLQQLVLPAAPDGTLMVAAGNGAGRSAASSFHHEGVELDSLMMDPAGFAGGSGEAEAAASRASTARGRS